MSRGTPIESDRSAWDTVDHADDHAKDIDDSTLKRHLAAPATAGSIMRDNGTNWVAMVAYYAQDAEPTLAADNYFAFWKDTNDSDRIYLVFRRGSGDQVKVELT